MFFFFGGEGWQGHVFSFFRHNFWLPQKIDSQHSVSFSLSFAKHTTYNCLLSWFSKKWSSWHQSWFLQVSFCRFLFFHLQLSCFFPKIQPFNQWHALMETSTDSPLRWSSTAYRWICDLNLIQSPRVGCFLATKTHIGRWEPRNLFFGKIGVEFFLLEIRWGGMVVFSMVFDFVWEMFRNQQVYPWKLVV